MSRFLLCALVLFSLVFCASADIQVKLINGEKRNIPWLDSLKHVKILREAIRQALGWSSNTPTGIIYSKCPYKPKPQRDASDEHMHLGPRPTTEICTVHEDTDLEYLANGDSLYASIPLMVHPDLTRTPPEAKKAFLSAYGIPMETYLGDKTMKDFSEQIHKHEVDAFTKANDDLATKLGGGHPTCQKVTDLGQMNGAALTLGGHFGDRDQLVLHGTTTSSLLNIQKNGLQPRNLDIAPELGPGFYTALQASGGTSAIATVHRRCDRTEAALADNVEKQKTKGGAFQFGDATDLTGPAIGVFHVPNFWSEETALFAMIETGKTDQPATFDTNVHNRVATLSILNKGCATRPTIPENLVELCPAPSALDKAVCHFLEVAYGPKFPSTPKVIEQMPLARTPGFGRAPYLSGWVQMKIQQHCYANVKLVGFFKINLSCSDFILQAGRGAGYRELNDVDYDLLLEQWIHAGKVELCGGVAGGVHIVNELVEPLRKLYLEIKDAVVAYTVDPHHADAGKHAAAFHSKSADFTKLFDLIHPKLAASPYALEEATYFKKRFDDLIVEHGAKLPK